MNCQNRKKYQGGPKENVTNSCLAKAINAFLGFPFMVPCGILNGYVYCHWANLMNNVLLNYKESLITLLAKHIDDPKSEILLGLLHKNDYFIESREVQTAKGVKAPKCDYEMTTIPLHGFSSLSEGIFLAMMLSQVIDPCNNNARKEILSLRIVSLDDYLSNLEGDHPKYDGEYGAITLNTLKNFGTIAAPNLQPHSVCLKYTKYPSENSKSKRHILLDALLDTPLRIEQVFVGIMYGESYVPDMEVAEAYMKSVDKTERERMWRSNVVVIVKENVAEPITTSGYNEQHIRGIPYVRALFNMYGNVDWDTSVVPEQYCR
jgi:hypothetical protein